MKQSIFATCVLLAACASAPLPAPPPMLTPVSAGVDAAGNRLEPMRGDDADTTRCTHDGQWCVDENGFRHGETTFAPAARDRAEPTPWPYALRVASQEAPLLGMLWRTSDSYSGGGASETVLVLYRFVGGRAEPVLEVLQAGDALIRACFSETDVRARRQACHDDYRFSSHISLDPTNASGWPVLRYETQAETFPGRVSRTGDSAERGPLTDFDLIWAKDEDCSTMRAFSWDTAANAYAPNAPLPECTDYLTQ